MLLPKEFLNIHCHGRDFNQRHKSTLEEVLSESQESHIGSTIFMPNTDPPLTDVETLAQYYSIIRGNCEKLHVKEPQYIYFGLTDDNLDQFDQALDLPYVVGGKCYPKKDGQGVTTGSDIGVSKNTSILSAMRKARRKNKAIAFHCDDPWIIAIEGNSINA